MQTLSVDLGDRSYPIYIGKGLLARPELLANHIHGHQVLVVSNETIAPLYLSTVADHLAQFQYSQVILPDGEQHKNLQMVSRIYDRLLEDKHNRTTTIIALGGGVIGDMAGYAAATYQRGVNFIQIPTTLLSQVDSSVGGKTGVNHALGKNMIGAFHQPQCVIADIDTLSTLPPRELSAGIAEVIKYGLICDEDFYRWLLSHVESLLVVDEHSLVAAVFRSCENKAKVVASDERESGIRAILNLGHTFGHAIETTMGYGQWLHGEAVAAGMVLALKLSCKLGWINDEELATATDLLRRARLPVDPPDMSVEQFMDLMRLDKKVLDGRLRLVLVRAIGDAIITSDVEEQLVRDVLLEAGARA